MPLTVEQIDMWKSLPSETLQLEFKAAEHNYDFDKACECCAAIANEGGGHLLLGISDRPPRRVVRSQAFPNTAKTPEQIDCGGLAGDCGRD